MALKPSRAWMREIQKSGLWYEPAYWREPGYLAASPWTVQELDVAFDAAKRIYPAKEAKRLFQKQSNDPLAHLLMDFWAPHISALVSLGFDASVAEPWNHRKLLQRLRDPSQYDGARFELALMAAFKRAGLTFRFEPLEGGQQSSNPDFELMLEGGSLLIDAKCAQRSKRREQEDEWFNALSVTPFLESPAALEMGVRIDCTEKFEEMLGDDNGGRLWIQRNIQALQKKLLLTLEELAQSASFPAEASIEGPTGTLVKLYVAGPREGSGFQSSASGPRIDSSRESVRIARNFLEKGASQIPAHQQGALIIEIGNDADVERLEAETRAWFENEGALHPQLLGVLLVMTVYEESTAFKAVFPVWRDSAPSTLRDGELYLRIEQGLNWKPECVARYWKRSQAAQVAAAHGSNLSDS